jgi:hypothetical protein
MEFKQDLICYSWSGWIRSLSEPTAWSFPLRLFPCRRGPDMPPPILISAARTYGHVAGLPCPALRWIYDLTRPRACMHASSDDQRYRAVAALAITYVSLATARAQSMPGGVRIGKPNGRVVASRARARHAVGVQGWHVAVSDACLCRRRLPSGSPALPCTPERHACTAA